MENIIDAAITFLLLMGAAGVALLIGLLVGPLLNIENDREE